MKSIMKIFIAIIAISKICYAVPSHNLKNDHELTSCSSVKTIFQLKNISSDIPDVPISAGSHEAVCPSSAEGKTCCTKDMEHGLKNLVRHDLQHVIKHNVLAIKGVLEISTSTYTDKLFKLIRESENHTHKLFRNLYKSLAGKAHEPITTLFSEIEKSLHAKSSDSEAAETIATLDLEDKINTFFSNLFPLVYRHSILNAADELSPLFSQCLQETVNELRPFGDIPRSLSTSLAKSIRGTKVLLHSLHIGIGALDSTERVWERGDECSTALLRMSYCAKCNAYDNVKPCKNYCLNVLRGCLLHLAELDTAWNGFVEALQKLTLANKPPSTKFNSEYIIRNMGNKISEAIMYAMENGPTLGKKVKIACGPVEWKSKDTINTSTVQEEQKHKLESELIDLSTPTKIIDESEFSFTLNKIFETLESSKRFHVGLADTLCSDSFAEESENAKCWNGQRVAEYSRIVVGPEVTAQKYNPEMSTAKLQADIRVAQINDQLHRTRQQLISQLSTSLESDSLILDGQGSGSGNWGRSGGNDMDNDDDEDSPNWEGSGSGARNFDTGIGTKRPKTTKPNDRNEQINKPTSAAATMNYQIWTLITSIIILINLSFK